MLTPLLWMVMTSIQTPAEACRFPPVLPSGIHWQNYTNAFPRPRSGASSSTRRSSPASSVIGNLVFCSLAGYAFARMRFFGRDLLFVVILATLMIPFQVVMIPTFLIMRHLGLIDSLGALILPNLVTPFGIFLMRQFFRIAPDRLEEASRIDGCSRLGTFFRIVLPLSGPALATLGRDHVPLHLERLPLAVGRDPVRGSHDAAARALDVPGRPLHRLDAADGGQRDGRVADAPRVRARAALLRQLDRRHRGEGLMAAVTFDHVTKVFDGKVVAVDALDHTVEDGEFMVLVGPSGCGKTTALRMVAGLEQPTSGTIEIDGRGHQRPSRRRTATSRWSSRTTRSTRT